MYKERFALICGAEHYSGMVVVLSMVTPETIRKKQQKNKRGHTEFENTIYKYSPDVSVHLPLF